MKQLKQIKKVPFLIISPILSIISEVILIFILLSTMESLVFNTRNMADILMTAAIGAAFWGIYGLVEFFIRKRREMKWYFFGIGVYLIPLVIWGLLTLVAYTYWYSRRLDEDAEFYMYFTRTMLQYLACATVFRYLGHVVFFLFDGGYRMIRKKLKLDERKARRKQKRQEKKALRKQKKQEKKERKEAKKAGSNIEQDEIPESSENMDGGNEEDEQ